MSRSEERSTALLEIGEQLTNKVADDPTTMTAPVMAMPMLKLAVCPA